MNIIDILKEALSAASTAGKAQYEKLEKRGPAYSVHKGNICTGEVGPAIGTMLDDCGGAWIILSGRNHFVNELKKIGIKKNSTYEGNFWWMTKGVYKGYTLHFRHAMSSRQEISVHEEAMNAARDVLQKYNIKSYVHTYID